MLSDPVKRHEYDNMGMLHTLDSNIAVTSQHPFVIVNPQEFYDAHSLLVLGNAGLS